MPGVHALTDVTGFGLLGHLLEICRASACGAALRWDALPLLPEALALTEQGVFTGASTRNWAGYGSRVELSPGVSEAQRHVLTDPQTSGGLLVACAADAVDAVLGAFRAEGFAEAREIGEFVRGEPRVSVA
jgi:selenide,water dikinase